MVFGDESREDVSDARIRHILGADFRANPCYRLASFDSLQASQREVLRDLAKDPGFYGVLIPRENATGGIKSICRETAILLLTLSSPGRLPAYIREAPAADWNRPIARLVLDGVLEISGGGGFVSGLEAYDLVFNSRPETEPRGASARLAREALEYAQALEVEDSAQLSWWLYFYNRLPLSIRWKRRFSGRDTVLRYLGIEPGGASRRLLENHWEAIKSTSSLDGWSRWKARSAQPLEREVVKGYKLYLNPHPDFMRGALQALLAVSNEISAHHLKFGHDALGLLRPDKIMVYFWNFETLKQAAEKIAARLAGCPAQPVPFTAAIGEEGLLSWGVDPPPEKGVLAWQEHESWRLWTTNRLASALLLAKEGKPLGVEPWRFALERLRLDHVDTETWTSTLPIGTRSFVQI